MPINFKYHRPHSPKKTSSVQPGSEFRLWISLCCNAARFHYHPRMFSVIYLQLLSIRHGFFFYFFFLHSRLYSRLTRPCSPPAWESPSRYSMSIAVTTTLLRIELTHISYPYTFNAAGFSYLWDILSYDIICVSWFKLNK